MNEKIKVLIVDDHPLLTMGLRMTIEKWDEFDVTGTAENGKEAILLCRELKPDLIIMDMQMPIMSGPEAIRNIKEKHPGIRILALTAFDDAKTISDAFEAGCEGFLLKMTSPEKMREVMKSIVSGIHVYDDSVIKTYKASLLAKKGPDFTDRELEILRYLSQGLTNAEIAAKVHLRTGTVKNLVSMLLSKTNSISRAKLVNYAMERHLI